MYILQSTSMCIVKVNDTMYVDKNDVFESSL